LGGAERRNGALNLDRRRNGITTVRDRKRTELSSASPRDAHHRTISIRMKLEIRAKKQRRPGAIRACV
jgi:hypothetical protein